MKLFILLVGLLGATQVSGAEKKFSNESSASIIVAGGNTVFKTYDLNTTNIYKLTKKNKLTGAGHYTYGTYSNVLTARNWDISLRYDRLLKSYNFFIGEQVEGDPFSGFDYRYNTDMGVGYTLIDTDKNNTRVEAGYRYSIEDNVDAAIKTKDEHLLRFFGITKHKFREGLNGEFWIEYIPNISDHEDFIIKFSPSLIATLSNIFSMKFSYTGTYDDDPTTSGKKNFDFSYTTSLIAKF